MDKGLSTKMGADKSAENTENAQKIICKICLTKPKSLVFWWKKSSLEVCSPSSKSFDAKDVKTLKKCQLILHNKKFDGLEKKLPPK